jgi:hypothetical protein
LEVAMRTLSILVSSLIMAAFAQRVTLDEAFA